MAASDDERVQSVYLVLGQELPFDLVFEELRQQVTQTCFEALGRGGFQRSWPNGPQEMEEALRRGVGESGTGPVVHGLRQAQARDLATRLARFVQTEVVTNREAAEALSRPGMDPSAPRTQLPPPALLARAPPGARVRIAAEDPEEVERLQEGFGGWDEEMMECLGEEGVVTAYSPAEEEGMWSVEVACATNALTYEWSPGNLRDVETGASLDPAGVADVVPPPEEINVGDCVAVDDGGSWYAGRVSNVNSDGTFNIDAIDGQKEEAVPRERVQTAGHAQLPSQTPEPILEGTVVRITEDAAEAQRLMRHSWSEELRPCLGQLGFVVRVRGSRIDVVSPAATRLHTWSPLCLRIDMSEVLHCPDLHEHPLLWWTNFPNSHICDAGCGCRALREAFRCPKCDFDVCAQCATPYVHEGAAKLVRTRHHLCPLSSVVLPRGPRASRWPCNGDMMPGGCRGSETTTAGARCARCEFLLCGACLADPMLGEATFETRAKDIAELPASASRIAAALTAHPSEAFAFAEAGLLGALASHVQAPAARDLALEFGVWLAAEPPRQVQAGPVLVDVGDETWIETHILSCTATAVTGGANASQGADKTCGLEALERNNGVVAPSVIKVISAKDGLVLDVPVHNVRVACKAASAANALPAAHETREKLLHELSSGQLNTERTVRRLLDERADVLPSDPARGANSDVLAVALANKAPTRVIEALLVAHTPIHQPHATASPSPSADCELDSPSEEVADTTQDVVEAVLALQDARLCALLAERGAALALAAGRAMRSLACAADAELEAASAMLQAAEATEAAASSMQLTDSMKTAITSRLRNGESPEEIVGRWGPTMKKLAREYIQARIVELDAKLVQHHAELEQLLSQQPTNADAEQRSKLQESLLEKQSGAQDGAAATAMDELRPAEEEKEEDEEEEEDKAADDAAIGDAEIVAAENDAKQKALAISAATAAVVEATAKRDCALACAAAADRLSVSRPSGSLQKLLRQFGRELLEPLLDAEDGGSPEPGGRLGRLLGALLVAGCTLEPQRVNQLAAVVVTRLSEEPGPAVQGALAFMEALFDMIFSHETSNKGAQRLLVSFRRHGAVARLEQLAVPGVVACPPACPVAGARVRQSVSGVSLNELRGAAKRLMAKFSSMEIPSQDEEVRMLTSVVARLPDMNALEELVEMVRVGTCTPYELSLHGALKSLLPALELASREWPWDLEPALPISAASVKVLVPALQTLLALCEAFPVAAADGQKGGLDTLVRPLELSLDGLGENKTIFVEPLLELRDLERFVLQTARVEDKEYCDWCQSIVGKRIAERPKGDGLPWRSATVSDLSTEKTGHLVHTVKYEEGVGEVSESKLLLHLREVVLLPDQASNEEAAAPVPASSCCSASLCVDSEQAPLEGRENGQEIKEGEVPSGEVSMPATQTGRDDAIVSAAAVAEDGTRAPVDAENGSTVAASTGDEVGPGANSGAAEEVEPHERVHKVLMNMPLVQAQEIPFDMVWEEMLEGGRVIVASLPNGSWTSLGWKDCAEMETALRVGLESQGVGPIARGLNREESASLVGRLGEVADALVVVVDRADVPQRRRPPPARAGTASKPKAKPPRMAGAICRRVQVGHGNNSMSGVAVWEHETGALDIIDQDGRFLAAVPASQTVPPARRARHSPGRAVPLELSVFGLSAANHDENGANERRYVWQYCSDEGWVTYDAAAVQLIETAYSNGEPTVSVTAGSHRYQLDLQAETQTNVTHPGRRIRRIQRIRETGPTDNLAASAQNRPRLDRMFSGVDRTPVHDFQHRVLARKLEAEQLQRKAPDNSLNGSLEELVKRGTMAPRLRVVFSRAVDEQAAEQSFSSSCTVLQALVPEPVTGREAEQRLRCNIRVEPRANDVPNVSRKNSEDKPELLRVATGMSKANAVGATPDAALVLAVLRRLRRCHQEAESKLPDRSAEEAQLWESSSLNRKMWHQLSQPLLATGGVTPAWVADLPLAYPFLFQRRLREQLLHCVGFGTSHAVLWLQRQSVEARFGERLRSARESQARTGNDAALWELHEQAATDETVFVGAGRSELVRLPSRQGLLDMAERVIEMTYLSKAMLEIVFADETGFGDGVTQSFYTDVSAELCCADDGSIGLNLWTEHSPSSITECQGRRYLHSRRGLFPRPHVPGSPASDTACRYFHFLGRLMAKALRDGFIVPLPLCRYFFEAVLGNELPLSALPQPGDGWAGEFVGAAASFAMTLRREFACLPQDGRMQAYREKAAKPGWARDFLQAQGASMEESFATYAGLCSFTETGLGGMELCPEGANRSLDAESLDEFVECAAQWWLRDGVMPQIAAFRQGVQDVCTSPAVWAFEASEVQELFCGEDFISWTKDELCKHLRPRGGYQISSGPVALLVEELESMTSARRRQFLEFVTACPRLPHGGLAAQEIVVVPAHPKGGLPRAHTCTNELQLPAYDSREELAAKLLQAMEGANGMYE